MRKLASFSSSLNLNCLRLNMQKDIRTLKQISYVGMIALCPRQVWWSWVHAPLRTVCQLCPTTKIARKKHAKQSITQRWIIRFRSNFVQSLNAWPQKCSKSSRSRGQMSRLQRDITYRYQKKRWNSGTDKLSKVKLDENYPKAERNT